MQSAIPSTYLLLAARFVRLILCNALFVGPAALLLLRFLLRGSFRGRLGMAEKSGLHETLN